MLCLLTHDDGNEAFGVVSDSMGIILHAWLSFTGCMSGTELPAEAAGKLLSDAQWVGLWFLGKVAGKTMTERTSCLSETHMQ